VDEPREFGLAAGDEAPPGLRRRALMASTRNAYRRGKLMSRVSEDEVLLLWRALRTFRSGKRPSCAPHGQPPRSICPLYGSCERWSGPDDYAQDLRETAAQTERRHARWPCSRLLEVLDPTVSRIT
jgi:hypothetical protein